MKSGFISVKEGKIILMNEIMSQILSKNTKLNDLENTQSVMEELLLDIVNETEIIDGMREERY